MENKRLYKAAAILAILVFVGVILVYAKPFLVPIAFAGLLSMVLLPVTKWLQSKGVNKFVSILLAVFSLVGFFALVGFFISLQLSNVESGAAQLEKELTTKFQQVQIFISEQMGIPPEKQKQIIEQQQSSSNQQLASRIMGFLKGLGSFLANALLVLVYIFLFIYFRSRLKGFIVRLVPKDQKSNAETIVNNVQKVSEKYFFGLFLMIVCLWIMYGIGFSIVGVKHPVFFAVLCGLLEIIPFVGNITGTLLTVSFSLVQGGGMNVVVGILITYGIVQFIQTYFLETLVVGAEVSINPLFTIVGLIAFEALWGIPGVILAIPIMGMVKIVCDHVAPLKPYAYLIGTNGRNRGNFQKRMKRWGKSIKEKIRGSS